MSSIGTILKAGFFLTLFLLSILFGVSGFGLVFYGLFTIRIGTVCFGMAMSVGGLALAIWANEKFFDTADE